MGEFNSDDHYIYYCGQESLRRNGVTLWTVASQAPLSMGFSWRGLSCPPPGDLPDLGIEPTSPALAGEFFNTSTTREA